jgi:hypothetical protein
MSFLYLVIVFAAAADGLDAVFGLLGEVSLHPQVLLEHRLDVGLDLADRRASMSFSAVSTRTMSIAMTGIFSL